MSNYAVVDVQVNSAGKRGRVVVKATGGATFDPTVGVWHRVWLVGNQGTEIIRPNCMSLDATTFVFDCEMAWGLNHRFAIKMQSNGTVTPVIEADGLKLGGPVFFRNTQNDG